MRHLILALLLVAGCPKPAPDPDPDTDTDPATDTDPDTDTDTAAWPTDPIGIVVVTHWPRDFFYEASTHLHAVFSREPGFAEVVDPIGLLAAEGVDEVEFLVSNWWPVPDVGSAAVHTGADPAFDPLAAETLDVGEQVRLGPDWEAYRTELPTGQVVYVSDREDAPPVGAFAEGGVEALEWLGGPDAPAVVDLGAAVIPTALDLPAHLDPARFHVEDAADDLVLTWTPSGLAGASVLAVVYGDPNLRVERVDDALGALTIPAARLQELGGDDYVATFARVVETPVATPIGTVLVRAIAETWTYHAEADELGLYPTEALTGELLHLQLTDREGRLTGDLSVDAGEGVFIEQITTFPGGERATVRVIVDEDAPTGPRDVVVTAGATPLTSDLPLFVRHPLPPADTCAGAAIGGDLRDGFYFSDMRRYTDTWIGDLDVCGAEDAYTGADAWLRVDLQAGEELSLSALSEGGDVAIALFDDCEASPLECYDDTGAFGVELLQFIAPETRSYWVGVDNTTALSVDSLFLYAERRAPADLDVYPTRVVQGTAPTIEVESRLGPFPGDTVFSAGDGVTVDAARLDGALAVLDLSIAADAAGDRTVTATHGGGAWTSIDSGLTILANLATADDCAGADALGPVASGAWRGSTLGKTDLGFNTDLCFDTNTPGADAVIRFELPSVGDQVSASLGSEEVDIAAYLVRSCASGAIPVACADSTSFDIDELLSFTAGPGDTGAWYLVIDTVGPETGAFDLILDVP